MICNHCGVPLPGNLQLCDKCAERITAESRNARKLELPNLKELKAILKLLRSQGVTEFNCPAMQIKLGDMPYEVKGGERVAVVEEDAAVPSDEDLAFYSAAPDPLAERLGEPQ